MTLVKPIREDKISTCICSKEGCFKGLKSTTAVTLSFLFPFTSSFRMCLKTGKKRDWDWGYTNKLKNMVTSQKEFLNIYILQTKKRIVYF